MRAYMVFLEGISCIFFKPSVYILNVKCMFGPTMLSYYCFLQYTPFELFLSVALSSAALMT